MRDLSMSENASGSRSAPTIKKKKLVASAARLFHRQGVATTTLAEVAADAQVALGNVYYYFRAKDDLVAAVADHRSGHVEALIARLDLMDDPLQRLDGLVQTWVEDRHLDALYGCPVGSLCFELARARGPLSEDAARPFRALLEWCEAQFRHLGVRDDADRHALHLVSALQGVSLTAAVFGDADLIGKEAQFIGRWLRSLQTPEV